MDLMAEIMENSGASVLCGGSYMTTAEVGKGLVDYRVNVLSGESSQVANMVHYISTLPQEQREKINIEKVIYTSEVLTPTQRAFIEATLGAVSICSVLGSAEAGPWAISNPGVTGIPSMPGVQDFIFDTRAMLIEILPASIVETGTDSGFTPEALPDGEPGIIVQTSLHRLRNPLVRYITGDIGSVHTLPAAAYAQLGEDDRSFFRILRLHGRDRRFSVEWDGMYFEFESLAAMLNSNECGVLQWQLILDHHENSPRSAIEVRLLCSPCKEISPHDLSDRVKTFFNVYSGNQGRLKVTFVDDVTGFVRSSTGNKVIKFVDRFN
jgi:phenylacetate-coenzyme A ligase PaaK-like adenylate-forming protein